MAERFKCHCYGIDAVAEFIEEAVVKAKEYSVDKYCEFEVADIRMRIKELATYDVIILGALVLFWETTMKLW